MNGSGGAARALEPAVVGPVLLVASTLAVRGGVHAHRDRPRVDVRRVGVDTVTKSGSRGWCRRYCWEDRVAAAPDVAPRRRHLAAGPMPHALPRGHQVGLDPAGICGPHLLGVQLTASASEQIGGKLRCGTEPGTRRRADPFGGVPFVDAGIPAHAYGDKAATTCGHGGECGWRQRAAIQHGHRGGEKQDDPPSSPG